MPKAQNNTTNPPVDAIFAAIDAHLTAIAELYRKVELFKEGAIDGSTLDAGAMCEAAKALVDTHAGLRALSEHLLTHFAYGSGFALCIERPFGNSGRMHGGGAGAAEWLIALRTAELGMRL